MGDKKPQGNKTDQARELRGHEAEHAGKTEGLAGTIQGHEASQAHKTLGQAHKTPAHAATHGQAFTTQELEAQGVTKYLRRRKIQAGELYRVHRGVFITTPTRHKPTPTQIAHALTRIFPTIAFCGHTAEQIYLGKPLTLPLHAAGPRTITGADFHITRSRMQSVAVHRGLRVISALWAAKQIPHPAALLQRAFAGRKGRTRFEEESATMRRMPSHLRKALPHAMIGADSQTERRLGYALIDEGLHIEHNVRVANYSFDIRVGRVLIEVDGFAYHRSQTSFITDRQKQNAGTLHQYIVLRYSTDCIDHHLRDVVAQIKYAVALAEGKPLPRMPYSARSPVWSWHQAVMPV